MPEIRKGPDIQAIVFKLQSLHVGLSQAIRNACDANPERWGLMQELEQTTQALALLVPKVEALQIPAPVRHSLVMVWKAAYSTAGTVQGKAHDLGDHLEKTKTWLKANGINV